MFGTTKRLRSMPFNLHFLTTLHFYVFVFLCSDGQEIVPRSFGQIKKIGRVEIECGNKLLQTTDIECGTRKDQVIANDVKFCAFNDLLCPSRKLDMSQMQKHQLSAP